MKKLLSLFWKNGGFTTFGMLLLLVPAPLTMLLFFMVSIAWLFDAWLYDDNFRLSETPILFQFFYFHGCSFVLYVFFYICYSKFGNQENNVNGTTEKQYQSNDNNDNSKSKNYTSKNEYRTNKTNANTNNSNKKNEHTDAKNSNQSFQYNNAGANSHKNSNDSSSTTSYQKTFPDFVINSFKVLEIEYTTDCRLIRQRWKTLMLIYHPDRNNTNRSVHDFAQKKSEEVNNAYQILKKYLHC